LVSLLTKSRAWRIIHFRYFVLNPKMAAVIWNRGHSGRYGKSSEAVKALKRGVLTP